MVSGRASIHAPLIGISTSAKFHSLHLLPAVFTAAPPPPVIWPDRQSANAWHRKSRSSWRPRSLAMAWLSAGNIRIQRPTPRRDTPPARPATTGIPEDTRAVLCTPAGDCKVSVAAATYEANSPSTDSNVIKAEDGDHVFAALFSADNPGEAPGLPFLRCKIHQQLQVQLRLQHGAIAAVTASFASIDAAYRRLHPFHGDVFQGVSLTLAYIDVSNQLAYLASCGSCQAAACSLQEHKAVHVASEPWAPSDVSFDVLRYSLSGVRTIPLNSRLDGIVLGSAGLWRELPPAKAMLRLQHYAHEVPSANACNPAAHLINYALHAVTGRMHKSPDLRMRALSSVGALQSLWVGSRANFPGHERMPMRRRRGDVHSDLTAVVIRLIWPGQHRLPPITAGCRLVKTISAPHMGSASAPLLRPTAAARWAHLRMHFLTFPATARRHTVDKWHEAVRAVLADARQRKQQEALAKCSGRPGELVPMASSKAFPDGGDSVLEEVQKDLNAAVADLNAAVAEVQHGRSATWPLSAVTVSASA